MTFLLDTDIVIYAIRNRPTTVRARLDAMSPDEVLVSSVTIAELWYGSLKTSDPERRRKTVREFLNQFGLLSFDRTAAEHHADIRHQLRHAPIGDRDLLIASIAIANDLTVVTHNTREFGRVPGLRVEDWSAEVD